MSSSISADSPQHEFLIEDAYDHVARLYSGQSLLSRLHVHLRSRYYPLASMLEALPSTGKIADIGCGQGVLTSLLAVLNPNVDFIGYEPNERRLSVAKKATKTLPNISFSDDGWQNVASAYFSGIVLVDVFHHIPREKQNDFLELLTDKLAIGGILLIHETDPSTTARWRYWWNYLSDILIYPFAERCHFRTPTEIQRFARQVGLHVEAKPYKGAYFFSTILYKCTKSLTSDTL